MVKESDRSFEQPDELLAASSSRCMIPKLRAVKAALERVHTVRVDAVFGGASEDRRCPGSVHTRCAYFTYASEGLMLPRLTAHGRSPPDYLVADIDGE